MGEYLEEMVSGSVWDKMEEIRGNHFGLLREICGPLEIACQILFW